MNVQDRKNSFSDLCRIKKSQGFSLLEVFVAITISLILLEGVLLTFLNSKSTYNLTNGYAQLQENARFIENYVVRNVRLAGYRSPPAQPSQFTSTTDIFTAALPYVTGTFNTGPNGSDTLTIRYQGSGNGTGTPDGTIVDCLNVAADANTIVTNTYSLTSNNELQCQAQNANSTNSNNTQILMSGVENFKVLFGEDLNGDFSADRYVRANYAYLTWSDIVSVRISLLLRSDSPVSRFKENPTFYMIGTSYTPTAADNYLRTPMSVTVLLRNQILKPF
ncbi:MAG: PilW family protein [Proteobacteria bacterium]|nr:PilW family protein [Pseudomonadota bacterium]